MWFNITSTAKGYLPNMDNVGSLAVDWVGKKIYWSNPKQQLVSINFESNLYILYRSIESRLIMGNKIPASH